MSEAVPTTAPAADPVATSAEHLAHLHKMSTTAGVTNLDYVALNQTAIVAVVFGVLSLLAFVSPVLLVIPLVGVVVGVVAIRQINASAGTQAGRGMAIAGLALSALLGGGAAAREVISAASAGGDKARIAATLAELGADVREGKYREAHALFDDEFRARVKLAKFESTWRALQAPAPAGVGPLERLEWNGVAPAFDSAGGKPAAYAKARIKFARSNDERLDVRLRPAGDRWLITDLPAFFPKERESKDTFDLPQGF
jgi:hypothetical protein